MRRRILLAVVGIALFGLALRVWYVLAVAGDAPLVGDGLEFHGLAQVISEGKGFVNPFTAAGAEAAPTAHKPPLYPLLLALPSTLGWSGHVAHQVTSAIVGAGTVVVLGVLAYKVAGTRAALIAAGLAAIYPVFVVTDAALRSESLYVLLVALALLGAYRAWERPSAWRLAQLGVVIGLAALTRSEGLALFVLLAFPMIWRSREGGTLWRLGLVIVACGLVLAPWLIRCWIAFDQPVAISTNSGDLIAGANCEETYAGPLMGQWEFRCVLGERGENEAVIADRLRARGFRYARDHIDRLPAVLTARALRPWGLYDPDGEIRLQAIGEGRDETANWIGLLFCWCLMILAAGGLLVLRSRGQPIFILLAPFALVLLVSVSAYGVLRFRAPADVASIVLAAVALDFLICRRRRSGPTVRSRRASPPAARSS